VIVQRQGMTQGMVPRQQPGDEVCGASDGEMRFGIGEWVTVSLYPADSCACCNREIAEKQAGTVRCSVCHNPRYCSVSCQNKHWESKHENECMRPLAPLPAALAAPTGEAYEKWVSRRMFISAPPSQRAPPAPLHLPGGGNEVDNSTLGGGGCDCVASILALVQAVPPVSMAIKGTPLGAAIDQLAASSRLSAGSRDILQLAEALDMKDADDLQDGRVLVALLLGIFLAAAFPDVYRAQSVEKADVCPVCAEEMPPYLDPVSNADYANLQCGHRLHTTCLGLITHLDAPNRACPVCKAPVVTEKHVRLVVPDDYDPTVKSTLEFRQTTTDGYMRTYDLKLPCETRPGESIEMALHRPGDGLLRLDKLGRSLNESLSERLRYDRARGLVSSQIYGAQHISASHGCDICQSVSFGSVQLDVMRAQVAASPISLEAAMADGGGDLHCRSCKANINGSWLLHADGTWRSVGHTSREGSIQQASAARNFCLTLPPVLSIEIERMDYRDGWIMDYSTVDLPVRGLEMSRFIPGEPPEGACTVYDLRWMLKFSPSSNCRDVEKIRDTVISLPGSRYAGYAVSSDDCWYEFDLRKKGDNNRTKPCPVLDTAARISSPTVIQLVYVRRDVLADSTVEPSSEAIDSVKSE